jgi:mRNA interferase MazF
MPEQKDIVLIPVPFTDLTSTRRRPAIVVSNNNYNKATDDMVVVAMTSNPVNHPYSFVIQQADLASGKLNRPGKVRVDKIYTLSQSITVKIFGKVKETVLDTIRERLGDLVISI